MDPRTADQPVRVIVVPQAGQAMLLQGTPRLWSTV
jgi:hypothetical protein